MHPNIPNTPLIESSNHTHHHPQSERDLLISECLPLIDHPLLSSPQHPILDEFKDFIQSGLKFNKSKPSLSKLLYSLIFQDKSPQQLHEFYASKQLSFDAVCSKIIAKNVAFYMCLDCDKLRKNDSALVCCLCKECFKASNHIGHRVLLSLNDDTTSSACDCGDSSVFDSAGFCKAHSQKSVSLDSIIEGIGLETVQKFRDNMSAAFYGLFSLIEISQGLAVHFQAEPVKVQKIRDIFTEVIHVMTSSFINLLEFLIAKVNSSFILIIADFLQSNLAEGNNLLKHNCTEIRKPIYTPEDPPHQCSCPIIELLLKYISAFTPVFQENLISFCNTMSKSEEFKSYMATIFMKTLYFSFYQDEPKHRERELYSKFAKANVHYYTNVDLCGKVVKEPFISNMFSLFHDVIESNKEPKVYFPPLIWELKSMTKCMLRPKSESCSTLIKDRKASVTFLEEAIHNANIHSYPGPIFVDMTYEDLNLFYICQVLGVSGMLESLVKRCLCQLQELPLQDAESLYEEMIVKWQELYVDFVKNQPAANEITFLSTIERIANYLIRGWDLNIGKHKTGKFLERISQNTDFPVPTIASQLLKGTLKQMGAIRKIYLIDPRCRREIGAIYLNDEYTLIDSDVTSIQMFLPWASSQNLFQDLLKSWFQYAPEVSEIILTGAYDKLTKNQLMVLNDFFGFLVFFMIDEICSLKLKLTKDPRNYLEEVDFTQDLTRVTRRVLINLLAGRNWVDINNVKESVKHMLWDSSIEDILPKLADKDEKTNKVRLREEYYNEVDPFLFSHKRILQKDLLDSLQGTDQKKVKVDPISGVYYTDLPDYCYEAQRAMFEGNLPEFLGTFVTKYNSAIESIDTLLRPVLRLILTHLQVINYLKNDVGILVKNLENYLTEEFEKSLETIRNTETMSDFVRVIDKIFDLLKIYMKQDHKEEKITQDEEEENIIEKKKKLAQQKMKELKEKFAQKQKNFMNQMSSELQEETVAVVVTEEAKEDNQSVACTLCLHKIDTANELYGFPCYINFASRLMIAGKDLDLPNQHFPALHGCGHLFHAKCFLDWKTKTHQPTGPHQILLNAFESFCPLCSNLVNEFCPLNQKETIEEGDGSAKELEIDVNNRMIKRLGVLKEFVETNDEAIWRENNPKLVEEFAKNGVKWLRNMYVLFFESLELASFDRFYKRFQLYADFLSCVKRQASFDIKFFEELRNNKEDLKNLTQEAALIVDILFIVLYQSPENKREEVLRRLSKYIEAKLEQGLRNVSEEVLLDKQKKLDCLQNIANEESFLKEYMPILEKSLMIYALVLYEEGSKEESRKIVENLFNQKTDTYFAYFNVSGFADIISDDIIENLDFPKEVQEDCKFIVSTTIKPKKVELPSNYQLFVDKYMGHKCAFCRDLPSHGEKMICLLCGEVLCRTRCSTKTKFSSVKLGNANIHSVYEHNGGGMFLEVHLLGLILVNFPKNMITSRNIYVDESGLSINNLTFNAFDKRLDVIDYKKFVLDVETIKYISGIVENYLIPLEQFQNAKNNKSKLYVEGVL